MNLPQAHIAVDLGAESGRVFIGRRERDILCVRELHRFANHPVTHGAATHWDVCGLWAEVCKPLRSPDLPPVASIGVDAWGVDYALIGKTGELLQNPRHYRDPRNVSAMKAVLERLTKAEIYGETGAQFLPINTLYQLFAAHRDTPGLVEAADRLLMIPDLFHYWLSGRAACEYTAASTTQFANPRTRQWSQRLLRALDLNANLPAEIVEPGTPLGCVKPHLFGHGSEQVRVIAPASHDTASAVAAIAANGDTAFLSSGTWSLLGTELDAPLITDQALQLNFTNEGGVRGTTRLLKNVMGLWMLQCCRRDWIAAGRKYNYAELMEAARRAPAFAHLVDPDDAGFLNPPHMVSAIDDFCRRTHQPVPASPAAYTRGILESLALKYKLVLRSLESLIGRPIHRLRVIGGGSKNNLLNQFTADATGKTVVAGPVEAAVLGNLAVQMVASGEAACLDEVRALIDHSFKTEIYEPRNADAWNTHAHRFQQYCELSYA